jgi:hypothetical protein
LILFTKIVQCNKLKNLVDHADENVEDISLQEPVSNVNEIKNVNDINGKRLLNIDRNLANIWNEMKENAAAESKEIKWKYAGIVLDRLFFFLTLFYSIITFCTTVLSIPNLYRAT